MSFRSLSSHLYKLGFVKLAIDKPHHKVIRALFIDSSDGFTKVVGLNLLDNSVSAIGGDYPYDSQCDKALDYMQHYLD